MTVKKFEIKTDFFFGEILQKTKKQTQAFSSIHLTHEKIDSCVVISFTDSASFIGMTSCSWKRYF